MAWRKRRSNLPLRKRLIILLLLIALFTCLTCSQATVHVSDDAAGACSATTTRPQEHPRDGRNENRSHRHFHSPSEQRIRGLTSSESREANHLVKQKRKNPEGLGKPFKKATYGEDSEHCEGRTIKKCAPNPASIQVLLPVKIDELPSDVISRRVVRPSASPSGPPYRRKKKPEFTIGAASSFATSPNVLFSAKQMQRKAHRGAEMGRSHNGNKVKYNKIPLHSKTKPHSLPAKDYLRTTNVPSKRQPERRHPLVPDFPTYFSASETPSTLKYPPDQRPTTAWDVQPTTKDPSWGGDVQNILFANV